jgi:predicted Zn-ribbon and HTH transcriptional regulator
VKFPPETLLFIYLMTLLVGVFAIAVYSERRRKRFEPTPNKDHIFRCGKCAFVYTDDSDIDRSRCPQCGMINEIIEF